MWSHQIQTSAPVRIWVRFRPIFRLFQPLREQARLPVKMDGMESNHINTFFCSQRPKPPSQLQLSKFHGHAWTGIPCIWSQIFRSHGTCEAMWSPATVAWNFHDAVSHHWVRFVRPLQPDFFFSQVAMLKRHHSNISEDRLVKDGTWVARWVCPGMKHTVPMDLGCTPCLDLFEETPTRITRGISQAVQIFVFLFVKKMTGSEALETIWNDVPTSPRWSLGTVKTMNGKQWQNIRIQGTCHFDRFCIHFQMVCTSHLRFKCTKMPVDWGLQPYIICPIWLMSNLVDVLLTYLPTYLLTYVLTYLLTYLLT